MSQILTQQKLKYCHDLFAYQRRKTREVMVGKVGVGGNNPIRVQSMTTTDTLNVEATIKQSITMIEAGCEIVRITAPTVNDSRALGKIKEGLIKAGYGETPLVADIHFSPAAAMEAADYVEKVRINPGNFVDTKRFAVVEYTDEEYAAELSRIEERFTPLVLKMKKLKRAMRIGTNHGSLSDRIMNRFGDSPLGMVESSLEFVRICEKNDYRDVIISMKSSNPKVMIEAYRLLAARMDELGMDYPFHLGVTEAGGGEDGRIKSAIGIGSLLADGIGDTIRVSLTEDPELEVPVCFELAAPFQERKDEAARPKTSGLQHCADFYSYARRKAKLFKVGPITIGGSQPVRVVSRVPSSTTAAQLLADYEAHLKRGLDYEILDWNGDREALRGETSRLGFIGEDDVQWIVEKTAEAAAAKARGVKKAVVGLEGEDHVALVQEYRLLASLLDDSPIVILAPKDLLKASVLIGSLLCDGIGDAVLMDAPLEQVYNILQGAGVRVVKTEFVSCPSCGRTLFDLQSTTERIKSKTGHLKGVKIAIMGCIVNGPGEMADADFGYVGGAPGKINLYVGKECVQKGIPTEDSDQALIELIKSNGKWVDPVA
jgi:(E)-4-hydroxy-3-methylbut-2-enyl-diphosphate synthase